MKFDPSITSRNISEHMQSNPKPSTLSLRQNSIQGLGPGDYVEIPENKTPEQPLMQAYNQNSRASSNTLRDRDAGFTRPTRSITAPKDNLTSGMTPRRVHALLKQYGPENLHLLREDPELAHLLSPNHEAEA